MKFDELINFRKNLEDKYLGVIWELTYKCNIGCMHCQDKGLTSEDLSLKEIEKILTKLSKDKIIDLLFTGGEPFVRKDFIDILEFARSLNNIFFINIASNLILVDAAIAKRIKKINVYEIETSLYGPSEIHDSFTKVSGSFDRTIKGIKNLRKLGVRITVNCVLNNFNISYVNELKKICESLGVKLQFTNLIFPTFSGNKENLKLRCDPVDLNKYLYYGKVREGRDYICGAGIGGIGLDPLGNVYPCSRLKIKIGNILENSFEEIWDNEVLHKIADLNLHGIKSCNHCKFKEYCLPCLAMNYLEHGDLFKCSDYICKIAKINYYNTNKKILE